MESPLGFERYNVLFPAPTANRTEKSRDLPNPNIALKQSERAERASNKMRSWEPPPKLLTAASR
jgi:hypothetical protein